SAAIKSLAQTITDTVDAGTPFTLSAWVKTNNVPVRRMLRMILQLYAGTTVKTYVLKIYGGTYDWKYYSLKVIAPSDGTKMVVTIKESKKSGQMWFDDVMLVYP